MAFVMKAPCSPRFSLPKIRKRVCKRSLPNGKRSSKESKQARKQAVQNFHRFQTRRRISMDFELSQDHKVLQSSVRHFVEKEIKPLAIQIDENHKIPDDLVQKMSAMGLLGSCVPEVY